MSASHLEAHRRWRKCYTYERPVRAFSWTMWCLLLRRNWRDWLWIARISWARDISALCTSCQQVALKGGPNIPRPGGPWKRFCIWATGPGNMRSSIHCLNLGALTLPHLHATCLFAINRAMPIYFLTGLGIFAVYPSRVSTGSHGKTMSVMCSNAVTTCVKLLNLRAQPCQMKEPRPWLPTSVAIICVRQLVSQFFYRGVV